MLEQQDDFKLVRSANSQAFRCDLNSTGLCRLLFHFLTFVFYTLLNLGYFVDWK